MRRRNVVPNLSVIMFRLCDLFSYSNHHLCGKVGDIIDSGNALLQSLNARGFLVLIRLVLGLELFKDDIQSDDWSFA